MPCSRARPHATISAGDGRVVLTVHPTSCVAGSAACHSGSEYVLAQLLPETTTSGPYRLLFCAPHEPVESESVGVGMWLANPELVQSPSAAVVVDRGRIGRKDDLVTPHAVGAIVLIPRGRPGWGWVGRYSEPEHSSV